MACGTLLFYETALTLSAFFFLLLHRARVIPDEAVLEDQAAPKRKRSDGNWRTARSVQSALESETAALEKCSSLQTQVNRLEGNLVRSQAQAKTIGHELFKSKKTHRQVVLQAEEEMGNQRKRHQEDVAAGQDLEQCLTDTKQELEATKKEVEVTKTELQYSISHRRVQGELHRLSLKRQSNNHHKALERVQTAGKATISELKASLFLLCVLSFLT